MRKNRDRNKKNKTARTEKRSKDNVKNLKPRNGLERTTHSINNISLGLTGPLPRSEIASFTPETNKRWMNFSGLTLG